MDTSTVWEKSLMNDGRGSAYNDSAKYLRGTHTMWCRMFNGKMVYTCLLNGTEPGANDGGYASISAALKVKGML